MSEFPSFLPFGLRMIRLDVFLSCRDEAFFVDGFSLATMSIACLLTCCPFGIFPKIQAIDRVYTKRPHTVYVVALMIVDFNITGPKVLGSGAYAACFVSGWVRMRCPSRWAGGCAWHGLPASALSARACMWVMRGTIFLSALPLMTFVMASSISLMIAVGPCVFSCGTRVKRTLLLAC